MIINQRKTLIVGRLVKQVDFSWNCGYKATSVISGKKNLAVIMNELFSL